MHYTKYTKEHDGGSLDYGFIFPIMDGVPRLLLVGNCAIKDAHYIGKELDAAEWAAKAIVERHRNPPPEAAT